MPNSLILPAEEIAKGARLDPVVEHICAELRAAGRCLRVRRRGQRRGRSDRASERKEGARIQQLRYAGRTREVFGDPLENIWKRCVFGFCGITDHMRKTFGVIVTGTDAERKAWPDEARRTALAIFSGGAGDTYRH
jgi:hypothetical protein